MGEQQSVHMPGGFGSDRGLADRVSTVLKEWPHSTNSGYQHLLLSHTFPADLDPARTPRLDIPARMEKKFLQDRPFPGQEEPGGSNISPSSMFLI